MTFEYGYKKNAIHLGYKLAEKLLNFKSPPVFLCVGHSYVLSDCLGAVVGELLSKKHNINAYVYGNLKHNVNSSNLLYYVNFIQKTHPNSPIIVVDSALGDIVNIGQVKLTDKAQIAGFTNKNASLYGNACILGYVNTTKVNSLMFLKSVKLKTILEMASFIANSINIAMYVYSKSQPKFA